MAKIGSPKPQPEPEQSMHPDDIALEKESVAYGKKYASEFCAEHATQMIALIRTYGDGDADKLLAELRERFWARLWVSKDGLTEPTPISAGEEPKP